MGPHASALYVVTHTASRSAVRCLSKTRPFFQPITTSRRSRPRRTPAHPYCWTGSTRFPVLQARPRRRKRAPVAAIMISVAFSRPRRGTVFSLTALSRSPGRPSSRPRRGARPYRLDVTTAILVLQFCLRRTVARQGKSCPFLTAAITISVALQLGRANRRAHRSAWWPPSRSPGRPSARPRHTQLFPVLLDGLHHDLVALQLNRGVLQHFRTIIALKELEDEAAVFASVGRRYCTTSSRILI